MFRISCYYCGKLGHHIANCHAKKNPKVIKAVWIPKYILDSFTNMQGPKNLWVPKISGWEFSFQDVLKPIEIKDNWTMANQDTGIKLPKKKVKVEQSPPKELSMRRMISFLSPLISMMYHVSGKQFVNYFVSIQHSYKTSYGA